MPGRGGEAIQEDFVLPRYFTLASVEVSDLNSHIGSRRIERPDAEQVRELPATLNDDGWWPTPLAAWSYPYSGPGPAAPVPGDYSQTLVGDRSDTSPYVADEPVTVISTGTFIRNMTMLLQALDGAPPA